MTKEKSQLIMKTNQQSYKGSWNPTDYASTTEQMTKEKSQL